MKQHMENKPKLQGFSAPFVGFSFFLSKPRLWWIPILTMLLCFLFLAAVGTFVAYYSWPKTDVSWMYKSYRIFRALGLGAFSAVLIWILFFPTFLNVCFEKLLKKVFLAKGEEIQPLSTAKALLSGLIIFKKTIFLRFIWLLVCFVTPFVYGPLGMVVSQVAIAHLAFIDGVDLSLTIKGLDAQKRFLVIHHNRFSLFMAGVIGGVIAFFFLPTLIIWLFWIPSLYVGALLFAIERI